MIKIIIPSYKNLEINNIVFDYNGTLALDGDLKGSVKEKLNLLSKDVNLYVVTADTYGNARENLKDTYVNLNIISQEDGTFDKLDFIKSLGSENTIAVGNGNNDSLMLKEAIVGISIIGREGACTKALLNSDLTINDIEDCLDLFLNPSRLKATLRG